MPRRRPLEERFWEKVDKGPHPKGCWLWIAATGNYGYGVIGRGGRGEGNARAHVLSFEWANGSVPNGLHVLHTCDVTACVNPAHLFVGTQRDNIRDAWKKGRGVSGFKPLRGERNYAAKLTEAEVIAIRRKFEIFHDIRGLAKEFGICERYVRRIGAGGSWRHLWSA